MIDHLAIGLLALIAVSLIVFVVRKTNCEDRIALATREGERRGIEGFKAGFAAGEKAAFEIYRQSILESSKCNHNDPLGPK